MIEMKSSISLTSLYGLFAKLNEGLAKDIQDKQAKEMGGSLYADQMAFRSWIPAIKYVLRSPLKSIIPNQVLQVRNIKKLDW